MDALDEEKFAVADRDEIVRVLGALASHRTSVNAVFNGGDDVLLTAVLAVDSDEQAVYLDTNANASVNERLLAAQRAQFLSSHAGATVKWTVDKIKLASFEGLAAFRIGLPETIRRIQRRGTFRIATPRAKPMVCSLRMPDGTVIELPLVDICAEGLGAGLPAKHDAIFFPGARFTDCSLVLPDMGTARFELVLQSRWEVELPNGHKSLRAGFAFQGMRPAVQSMVQRYVNKLERQRIAALPH